MGKRKGNRSLSRQDRQAIRQAGEQAKARRRERQVSAKENQEKSAAAARVILSQGPPPMAELAVRAAGEVAPWLDRSRREHLGRLAAHVASQRPGLLAVPYLHGLTNLAMVSYSEPPGAWQPQGRGLSAAFRSLVVHLLGGYKANAHLVDSLLVAYSGPQETTLAVNLVKAVISGESLYRRAGTAELPPPLTRRMCHLLANPDCPRSVVAAARRAQVLAHGGGEVLARAMVQGLLAHFMEPDEELFWDEVIHWFCRQDGLDSAQVGPLCDYLGHRRGQDRGFRLKGRSLAAVTRGMLLWHKELSNLAILADQLDYPRAGFKPVIWRKTRIVDGRRVPGDQWALHQIISPKALVAEGAAMRHCVATYHQWARQGVKSLWSLTFNGNRRVTIEVDNPAKQVAQVRGRYNRLPRAEERDLVRDWAGRNGLGIRIFAMRG